MKLKNIPMYLPVITNGPKRTVISEEGVPPNGAEPIKHSSSGDGSSVNAHNKGFWSDRPVVVKTFHFKVIIQVFCHSLPKWTNCSCSHSSFLPSYMRQTRKKNLRMEKRPSKDWFPPMYSEVSGTFLSLQERDCVQGLEWLWKQWIKLLLMLNF